jgi:hypothetical protein
MKKVAYFILGILLFIGGICYAQADPQGALVIRQGKQLKKIVVTVEAYLVGDILEITAGVRKRGERIKINGVALQGPRIGKIHYRSRKRLPPSVEDEDEEPYPVTKVDGLIMFGNRTKEKIPQGRLNKALFKLKVPTDKIVRGKPYELIVDVESEEKRTRIPKFRFELEDFAEIVSGAKEQ